MGYIWHWRLLAEKVEGEGLRGWWCCKSGDRPAAPKVVAERLKEKCGRERREAERCILYLFLFKWPRWFCLNGLSWVSSGYDG